MRCLTLWCVQERHLFGQPKSEYDFGRRSPGAAREKLVELQEEQDKYDCLHTIADHTATPYDFRLCRLSKKINKKVMSMFEKAEQEYQDLMQRKSIIENDKDKIEKVITELDAKKNETLKKTWAKVNRDFGSIFSTLLPGANAKLEPEEGKSVSKLSRGEAVRLSASCHSSIDVTVGCNCFLWLISANVRV